MIIPKKDMEIILAGIENQLLVAVEDQQLLKKCSGLWLQSQGIHEITTKEGIIANVDP